MKILSSKRIIAAAVVVSLTIGAVLLAGKKALPPLLADNSAVAVPAESKHAENSVAAVPDTSKEGPQANNFTDVKYMVRGYCFAKSQGEDSKAPGGFGPCDNEAHEVRPDSPGHGLFLLAQPNVEADFGGTPGMRLLLVNQTNEVLAFQASDSRLSIVQEAKDQDGNWKPIEYLPSSWCGNSFHRVFLKPNYFWEFPAPRYQGSMKTKLRYTLRLADGSEIHSNQFEGSVNSEQFTIKQGHTPTNIMDPYDE